MKTQEIEEIDDGQEEDTISIEEMKLAMKKMKIKKTCGIDGIPIEVWLFAGEGVKRRLLELMTKAWKKGNILEDWKKSI